MARNPRFKRRKTTYPKSDSSSDEYIPDDSSTESESDEDLSDVELNGNRKREQSRLSSIDFEDQRHLPLGKTSAYRKQQSVLVRRQQKKVKNTVTSPAQSKYLSYPYDQRSANVYHHPSSSPASRTSNQLPTRSYHSIQQHYRRSTQRLVARRSNQQERLQPMSQPAQQIDLLKDPPAWRVMGPHGLWEEYQYHPTSTDDPWFRARMEHEKWMRQWKALMLRLDGRLAGKH